MRFLLFTLVLFLSACATHGNKIDTEYASSIEEGVTTESQVLANLGSPLTVTRGSDGTKTLVYSYSSAQANAATFIPVVGLFAGGVEVKSEALTIVLKDGIVESWYMSESEQEIMQGLLNK